MPRHSLKKLFVVPDPDFVKPAGDHLLVGFLESPAAAFDPVHRDDKSGAVDSVQAMNEKRHILGLVEIVQKEVYLFHPRCSEVEKGNVVVFHPESIHQLPFPVYVSDLGAKADYGFEIASLEKLQIVIARLAATIEPIADSIESGNALELELELERISRAPIGNFFRQPDSSSDVMSRQRESIERTQPAGTDRERSSEKSNPSGSGFLLPLYSTAKD